MAFKTLQQRDELTDLLNEADTAYRTGNPILTDPEYDEGFRALQDLEAAFGARTDSPTQRVGHAVTPHAKWTRTVPMLSIENAFTDADLLKWAATLGPVAEYLVQPKCDGCAVEVDYVKGKRKRITTRGDGLVGDDITHLAKGFKNLPDRVDGQATLTMRGEVLLACSDFERLKAEKGVDYANERNTVAGWLRRKVCPTKSEKYPAVLGFQPYALLVDGKTITNPAKFPGGFEGVLPVALFPPVVYDASVLPAVAAGLWEDLAKADWLFDGVVVKAASAGVVAKMGDSRTAHRWAVARKFASDHAVAILEKVEWQNGRTGRLTPRATFSAVQLAGTKVTHATLHNLGYVDTELGGLRIGDEIEITKAGEIIPKVVRVAARVGKGDRVAAPPCCPSCNCPAVLDGAHLVCKNGRCPEMLQDRLAYYASRDCMDIQGLGPEVIRMLAPLMAEPCPYVLHTLNEADMAKVIGKVRASRIAENIREAAAKPWPKVLQALGIPSIGESASEALGDRFPSLPEFIAGYEGAADALPGTAAFAALCEGMAAGAKRELVRLSALDVGASLAPKRVRQSIITGKRVCVTGTMAHFSRSEAEAAIKELGGIPQSGVTGTTDLVVAGPGAGSKLKKAEERGLPIHDDAWLWGLYKGQ